MNNDAVAFNNALRASDGGAIGSAFMDIFLKSGLVKLSIEEKRTALYKYINSQGYPPLKLSDVTKLDLKLKGKRTLKPERVEQLAQIMNTTTKKLMQPEVVKKDKLTVNIRGELTNRRSRRELTVCN